MKYAILLFFSYGRKAVECRSVYTVKLNPDESLANLKARLVAKGFSQVYGMDYRSLLAGCKADICADSCFFGYHSSLALHQLDVKNIFLCS